MTQRARGLVLLIWLCFLARAGWHAVALPLWGGFDEFAHVAYAQRLAAGEGLPVPGVTRVSKEVQASLSLTPMPAVPLGSPHRTYAEYWTLPAKERVALREELDALPRAWAMEESPQGERSYQAQHPPLYYLALVPVQRAASGVSLPGRVLGMRLATLLIASLIVPLTSAVLVRAGGSPAAGAAGAALVAALPMPVMTAARVGNDGLGGVLFAALLWLAIGLEQRPHWGRAAAAGLVLGAGLLTKAYFLTAVPALAILWGWLVARNRQERGRTAASAVLMFAMAGAVSFWWYWRNLSLTGSWSGLQQLRGQSPAGLADEARQAAQTDWLRFADIGFNTHLWVGQWSFLSLRSWIYELFLAVFAVAAAGLVVLLFRGRLGKERVSRFAIAAAGLFCACFAMGLAYHELTFSRLGLSASAGWYTVALAAAEVLLLTFGWLALFPRRFWRWSLSTIVLLFAALDFYGANFLLTPFFTGLISYSPAGRLASFHLSQLSDGGLPVLLGRISAAGVVPAPAVAGLWIAYAAATIALPVLAWRVLRPMPD